MKPIKILTALFIGLIGIIQLSAQTQKGADIDGEAAYDRSGNSVSMPDAYTLAIGASRNDGTASFAGHVRIYSWNRTAWVQKGSDIDGEAGYDYSGLSVSMPDSNTVAIGAPYNDGRGTNSGHVRIYSWSGKDWVQKGGDINGESENDLSGYSVSMPDSNTVAVGAIGNDGNAADAGHVRVYSWSGTAWVKKGGDINGEAENDQSGFSVSMPDPNTLAIGTPYNDGTGTSSGHVRIYSWNGKVWAQKGGDIDGEGENDRSGSSISMPDSNTVAIGAPLNAGATFNAGHVRIYSWNGAAWVQKGGDIDGEETYDQSGISVSMPDSNTVAIGATKNDGTASNAGHVRKYSWSGTTWVQHGGDIDGEAASDELGYSVSMPDANTLAVGAPLNTGIATNAGHVRVYTFCESTMDTIDITACYSYESPSKKYIYTQSGAYSDTITNSNGCDSVITINLTVNKLTTDTIDITACNSYESPSKKYTYNQSGTYYDTILNAKNCDSIITINLTINSADVSVTNTSPTLTANAIDASYQWLDCDNNFSEISNANSQLFLATSNGNYAVEVIQYGCTDTSECINVSNAQIIENTFGTHFKVFPNPTKNEVNIELGKHYVEVLVILRNAVGQEVMRKSFNQTEAFKLNILGETGFYILELHAAEHKALMRVLKIK